ncbi:MAG: SurA N-terminal domain-containing protein [Proteobacteria bacterium]|nr:SurA N-terminal domain-containing protein [Pseudomonadota bacterium]MBU1686796.1 SurA N-terminal domain-containing protein [Pseudomonadota bacterium]
MRPSLQKPTRHIPILILFFLILPLHLSGAAQTTVLDRVVAVVNDEVITLTELLLQEKEILPPTGENLEGQLKPGGISPEVRRKILTDLIDRILIRQQARKFNLAVSTQDIDEAIDRISRENGKSVPELMTALGQAGISEAMYRNQLSDQILKSKIISYEISSKIVISEEKALQYYTDTYTINQTAEGYHILQMGFTWNGPLALSGGKAEAQIRAERVHGMALEGQNFSQLALAFSELPSAKDGGNLGIITTDEMSESMQNLLKDMEPGRISQIIEVQDSLQFFMVVSINTGGTTRYAPFEAVQDEINSILYKAEVEKRYNDWLDAIRDTAVIRESLDEPEEKKSL